MDGVTIAFSVLAALASFVIAAVVIGREARRLDSVAPRAVYDLDQAIEELGQIASDLQQGQIIEEDDALGRRLVSLQCRITIAADGLES